MAQQIIDVYRGRLEEIVVPQFEEVILIKATLCVRNFALMYAI
jgi:hypothetical protein